MALEGRIPPHSLEAERSVLGSILLDPEVLDAVESLLPSPEAFYAEAHRRIYRAMQALRARGHPVDLVTLTEELARQGELDRVGGAGYLVELSESTPTAAYAEHYARIVAEKWTLRRLIQAAGEAMRLAYEEAGSLDEILDQAGKRILEVALQNPGEEARSLRELVHETFAHVEELYHNKGETSGVRTGFKELDSLIGTLAPGSLNIIAARPAMGKCVAWDTPIPDPQTGALRTAEEVYQAFMRGEEVWLFSLGPDGKLVRVQPSAAIADGVKPVYRVRTRQGREVKTTLSHPFLTPKGWCPLLELKVGDRIALPRTLPLFGQEAMPEAEVVLLAYLIGDGNLTSTSPRLTATHPAIQEDLRQKAQALGLEAVPDHRPGRAQSFRLVAPRGQPNPLIPLLQRHGLWGKKSGAKAIPEAVYRLPKAQLALFLNRLFATDGSVWLGQSQGRPYGRISYSTTSKALAQGVQHLLLRFGINARLRAKKVRYRGGHRLAYELEVMAAPEIRRFIEEIGILGKEERLKALLELVLKAEAQYTRDTLPLEVWDRVLGHASAYLEAKARAGLSQGQISVRVGKPQSHNWHPHRRLPGRETVALLAQVLEDPGLEAWAEGDIYWDEIVGIEPLGEERVFDFTVPGTHNFVAGDFYLHNTAFALSIAQNAALKEGVGVGIYSLEMPANQLVLRLLCSEARIDMNRVRQGLLSDRDFGRLVDAAGRLAEAPIYIDDSPDLTLLELRARARKLKNQHGVGLIVIDYLQLMSGPQEGKGENRQQEIAAISRGLKALARELNIPVVALSQLSRAVEARPNKRPMLSDLRESGSIEQDADLVMFIYRDEYYNPNSEKRGIAEIIVGKQRNGPTGVVELQFHAQHVRFNDLAKDV